MDHADGYFVLRTGEGNYECLKRSSAKVYGVCNLTPKKKILTVKISAIYLRANLVQRVRRSENFRIF